MDCNVASENTCNVSGMVAPTMMISIFRSKKQPEQKKISFSRWETIIPKWENERSGRE
jgi:hypothetical protein